jgi:hypothetical protein
MTDQEVFELGRKAYREGQKNIPPYSISVLRMSTKERIGTARIWMNGWESYAKLATDVMNLLWDRPAN